MKLFVAKLNRDAVESDLIEWFGTVGPVKSAKIVTDRETGQSKCFGFVEMANRSDGEKAIAELNGEPLMGFRIVIKEAEDRPRTPRDSGYQSGAVGRESDHKPMSRTASTGGSSGASDFRLEGAGVRSGMSISVDSSASHPKKSTSKKKSRKEKPDKYADGPRSVKMKKKPRGGGQAFWGDMDEEI